MIARHLTGLLVCCLVGILGLCRLSESNRKRVHSSVAPTAAAPLRTWTERVDLHLNWAKRESDKCLNEQLAGLDQFFVAAKTGTPKFVDKALGWGGKWRCLLDKVPFIKGDRHRAFLAQAFQDHIFTGAQLERTLTLTVAGFVTKIEAIENQLLVKIRQDAKDLPNEVPAAAFDAVKLKAAFDQALADANAKAGRQVHGEIAKEIVSMVTAEVLTQAAVKMSTSAGILGAGAASSWATLGAGLVIGVAADQIVSSVWNRVADPKGKLVKHVNAAIDNLQHRLVHGDGKVAGLRQHLQELARQRDVIRREVIQALQKGGDK